MLFPRSFSNDMKLLYFSFFLIILLASFSVEGFSQQSNLARHNETTDWSALFPKIPNCERIIQPLTQNGEVLEQVAIYEREGYKNNQSVNYFGCGSITLRFEPSARKAARENSKRVDFFPRQIFQIKNFDAYQDSPQCGNDVWIGSTTIYFDKDKVLIVSAYGGAEKILEFAQNADYELMKKLMNKLVKNKARQN